MRLVPGLFANSLLELAIRGIGSFICALAYFHELCDRGLQRRDAVKHGTEQVFVRGPRLHLLGQLAWQGTLRLLLHGLQDHLQLL